MKSKKEKQIVNAVVELFDIVEEGITAKFSPLVAQRARQFLASLLYGKFLACLHVDHDQEKENKAFWELINLAKFDLLEEMRIECEDPFD